MDGELAALAGTGASTLVGLMVTDAWERVRGRIARLLAGDGDVQTAEGELRRARDGVLAARDGGDPGDEEDYRAEWAARLRRLLRADPEAARQLFTLLDELRGEAAAPPAAVHNTISGGVQHGVVIQGRDFSGGLTFTTPSAAPPPAQDDETGGPA